MPPLRVVALGVGLLLTATGTARAQVGYPGADTAPGDFPGALPTAYLGDPGYVATAPAFPGALPTAYLGDPGYVATPPAFATAEPFGLTTPGGQAPYGSNPTMGGPQVALPVTPLRLSDGPGTVDVQVTGAPPFRGFELLVTYDPTVVALTAVSAGDLVTGAGGTLQPLGPILDTPGSVRYGVTLADTAAWPQGDGVLMRLTFAPLAQGALSPVRLAEAALVDPTGQRLNATTRDGAITVMAAPPAAAQTEAVASATALALATPAPAGAAGGAGTGLAAARARLGDAGAVLGWLAALALGLAVALVGWALGRR
jgi:hypothetical protein